VAFFSVLLLPSFQFFFFSLLLLLLVLLVPQGLQIYFGSPPAPFSLWFQLLKPLLRDLSSMSIFDQAFDFLETEGAPSKEGPSSNSGAQKRKSESAASDPKKTKVSDIVKESVKEAAAQKKAEKDEKLQERTHGGPKKEPEIDLKQVIESSKAVRHEVSVPKGYPYVSIDEVSPSPPPLHFWQIHEAQKTLWSLFLGGKLLLLVLEI